MDQFPDEFEQFGLQLMEMELLRRNPEAANKIVENDHMRYVSLASKAVEQSRAELPEHLRNDPRNTFTYHHAYKKAQTVIVDSAKKFGTSSDPSAQVELQEILDTYLGFRILDMLGATKVHFSYAQSYVGNARFFNAFIARRPSDKLGIGNMDKVIMAAGSVGNLYLDHFDTQGDIIQRWTANSFASWKDYFGNLADSPRFLADAGPIRQVLARRESEKAAAYMKPRPDFHYDPENALLYLEKLQHRFHTSASRLLRPEDDIDVLRVVVDTLWMMQNEGNDMAGRFLQILDATKVRKDDSISKGQYAASQFFALANRVIEQKNDAGSVKKLPSNIQYLPDAIAEILEWCLPQGDAMQEWQNDQTHLVDLMHIAIVEELVKNYAAFKYMTRAERLGSAVLQGFGAARQLTRIYDKLGVPAKSRIEFDLYEPGFGMLS